jgi:hypothetical protein
MKPTLYMETTGIPAGKTVGEITDLLVRSGAKQIATGYLACRGATELDAVGQLREALEVK